MYTVNSPGKETSECVILMIEFKMLNGIKNNNLKTF